jgi:hypothetical protein
MTGLSPQSHSALLLALLALAAIESAATTLIDYRRRLPDDRIADFLHLIDQQTDPMNAGDLRLELGVSRQFGQGGVLGIWSLMRAVNRIRSESRADWICPRGFSVL